MPAKHDLSSFQQLYQYMRAFSGAPEARNLDKSLRRQGHKTVHDFVNRMKDSENKKSRGNMVEEKNDKNYRVD